MFDDVIIMAGGSGTRLWPASNSKLPKQFLPAETNKCFFDLALERALAVTGINGRVIIIAGKTHIPHVINCAVKLNAKDKKRLLVIGEPCAQNTAPAVACAVKLSLLETKTSARKMLVLTSDHIVKPLSAFKKNALQACETDGSLTVFGIPVTRPDTGYGYIEVDISPPVSGLYKVASFHEKPTPQKAVEYSQNSRFFWNSGMFAFNNDFIAEQFRMYAPEVFSPFENLKPLKTNNFSNVKGVKVLKSWQGLENTYKKIKSISFDYAIAEKCSNKTMVKTNFEWIDIGDWEEYARFSGNISKHKDSHVFFTPEEGTITNTNYVNSDIPVALAGVNDLIVVIRNGKALITKKGQTQKVKEIVELIKKSGKKDLY